MCFINRGTLLYQSRYFALSIEVLCFINRGTFWGQKKGLKPALERQKLALLQNRLDTLDKVDIVAQAHVLPLRYHTVQSVRAHRVTE